jgi:hypothetical protein
MRDEVVVSAELAARLLPYIPSVQGGMLIVDALELVFSEQEPHLIAARSRVESPHSLAGAAPLAGAERPQPPAGDRPASPRALAGVPDGEFEPRLAPLDEAGARELTQRIRNATRHTCMLLVEAHERRAWSALGYRTWEQYVQREFRLSRSRSYELLDQARVIRELRGAAGISEIPDISAYAALQIKPHLREITQDIRDRTPGLSPERAIVVVAEVVEDLRARVRAERQPGSRRSEERTVRQADLTRLFGAIDCLAAMPPPTTTAAQIPDEAVARLVAIDLAVQWLARFAAEWRSIREDADQVA